MQSLQCSAVTVSQPQACVFAINTASDFETPFLYQSTKGMGRPYPLKFLSDLCLSGYIRFCQLCFSRGQVKQCQSKRAFSATHTLSQFSILLHCQDTRHKTLLQSLPESISCCEVKKDGMRTLRGVEFPCFTAESVVSHILCEILEMSPLSYDGYITPNILFNP